MGLDSEKVARKARISSLLMCQRSSSSHIASSLSVIDILSVIASEVQLVEQGELGNELIVSKGHAAAGVYAVLAHTGYLSISELENYGKDGAILGGHVTNKFVKVLQLSTGSLGHGLPFALGRALSRKLAGVDGNSYVVLSDGECDEGSNWEAALLASHLGLNNLSIIIDRNFLQSLASTEDTVSLESLSAKWDAFNWDVETCDGHDHAALTSAIFRNSTKPKVTIANTTKGYGVSFMENRIEWHYRSPSLKDLQIALSELQPEL